MDSSQFSDNQSRFDAIEQMESRGATCDTFRVKLYGKLHFLKRLKAEYAGDIRYSVTVDDMPAVVWSLKEPFRSEEWKRNVLRNQALRHQTIHLSSGSHQLTIKALDDHIVVDQWKLTAVKAK